MTQMHAVEADVGLPTDADPAALIDGADMVRWTDQTADLLLLTGEAVVVRMALPLAEAERLAAWVDRRLIEGEAVRVAEVLAERGASGCCSTEDDR